MAAYTPELTGFVAKAYGERPASEIFQMESGGRTKLKHSRGVQREAATGPNLFFLPLRLVLTRVREECESQVVEVYPYLDAIIIAAHEISPGTVGVVSFLERELTGRGTHLNPSKTVALASGGHVPTPGEMSLLAGVGVLIAQ